MEIELMRPFYLCFVLALSVISCAVTASGQGPVDPVKKEWNDRYGELAKSITKKDLKKVRAMVAANVVWTMKDGAKLTLTQAVADYTKKLDALKPNTQFTINCTKMTVTPEKQALIERTQIISGFYKDSAAKRHQAFDGSAWRDTWRKTAKGWMLTSSEQANQTLTVDGRPGSPYVQTTNK